MFSSLTPEFFDTLIVVVLILGAALAIVRLYADFTRPLPGARSTRSSATTAPETLSDTPPPEP